MKKILTVLSLCLLFVPNLSQAAVVTSQEMIQLKTDLNAAASTSIGGCEPLFKKSLTAEAYGGMGRSTDWKTMSLGSGITIKIPWSQYWYVLGKQIPWYEEMGNGWILGRYKVDTSEVCVFNREYNIQVTADARENTIKKAFGPKPDGVRNGQILEEMVINGKRVALVDQPGEVYDQQSVAVEVTKNKTQMLVIISAKEITPEMIRMAANVK